MENLHIVPRFDDSLSYVYVEHVRVDRAASGIVFWDDDGCTEAPVAALRLLMLGPGTPSLMEQFVHWLTATVW